MTRATVVHKRRNPSRRGIPTSRLAAPRPLRQALRTAIGIVDRSGVVPVLSARLDSNVGRPRALSVRGFLVACMMNALERQHVGHLEQVARILNSLSPAEHAILGIRDWDERVGNRRVSYLFNRLVAELDKGWTASLDGEVTRIDVYWFGGRLALASVRPEHPRSRSIAVDSTDFESWGMWKSGGSR